MTPPPQPAGDWVVVGLDNGGTANNATVLTGDGRFLVDALVESPSRVTEGPTAALQALLAAYQDILARTGCSEGQVRAVGLDSPGPASADGVISRVGATNFGHPDWRGFDFRGELEKLLGVPVIYHNDGNAAALYAHRIFFGDEAPIRSSVSAIVGTGLGGGIIVSGAVIRGAAGMAGELGHVHIPLDGILADGQPVPRCNCGFRADAESIASLSAIERNLLPFWLSRYPGHALAALPIRQAAREVRPLAEQGDPLALDIFRQQAAAIGRLFTILANVIDPDAYFIGGGVVQATEQFREWFLAQVRAETRLRPEQQETAAFALTPDLDMAGARGVAMAARDAVLAGR